MFKMTGCSDQQRFLKDLFSGDSQRELCLLKVIYDLLELKIQPIDDS